MARIDADCELLYQALPEKTLTEADHFHCFQYLTAGPIIFCTTGKGVLLLIATDSLGQVQVINLSTKFELSSPVKALAVSRDFTDRTKFYISFATQVDPTSPSILYVNKSFQTGPGSWWERIVWKSLIIPCQEQKPYQIHRLLLDRTSTTQKGYPFLACEISQPSVAKRNMRAIGVSATWKWEDMDLLLSCDVSQLINVRVASLGMRQGLLYLSEAQQQRAVTFTSFRDSTGYGPPITFRLPTLRNTSSLDILTDKDGNDSVIMSGEGGLLYLAAQVWKNGQQNGEFKPPNIVDAQWSGAHRLQIAQDKNDLTIYAVNGKNNVVFQKAELYLNEETEIEDLKVVGPAVPILPQAGAISQYVSLTDYTTKRQQIYVLKKNAAVVRLEQPGDSNLWTERDMKIPNYEDVQEMNTYTCRISCLDTQGKALREAAVQIQSSTQVRGAINGEIAYLTKTFQTVKTDETGNLTIILPATDFTAPTIFVSTSDGVRCSFNPAAKALDKLANAAKQGKLQEARGGRNNGKLFPKVDAKSSQAIVKIHEVFQDKLKTSAAALTEEFEPQGLGDDWAFLHAIYKDIEARIKNFIFEAGTFIIETAEKTWRFVVMTAEQALKALSAFVDWLGEQLEDALVWLASKLDWESILDVQLYLNALVTQSINCIRIFLKTGGDHVDGCLAELETAVRSWSFPMQLPGELKSKRPDVDPDKDKEKTKGLNNPCAKWVESRMSDQQVQNSVKGTIIEGKDVELKEIFEEMWSQMIVPVWNSMEKSSQKLFTEFRRLLNKKDSITFQDVFNGLGKELLLAVIAAARQGCRGLVKIVDKILAWFLSFLNKPINIWVITKVYARVTGGRQLTMFNLASLVFAVPMTYLMKAICDKKPGELPILAKLLRELKSSSNKASYNDGLILVEDLEDIEAYATTIEKDAHTADTVKKYVDANKPVGDLIRLCRAGGMLIAAGMMIYTPLDCVWTATKWPTATTKPPEFPGAGFIKGFMFKYERTISLISFIVVQFGALPSLISKMSLKRKSTGVGMRCVIFVGLGIANYFKSLAPENCKPAFVGIIGFTEMIGYGVVYILEGFGEEHDTWAEMGMKLLEVGWAQLSFANALTKCAEPIMLVTGAAVGQTMTILNIVQGIRHIQYWKDRRNDDDYDPPRWGNSLGGSFL